MAPSSHVCCTAATQPHTPICSLSPVDLKARHALPCCSQGLTLASTCPWTHSSPTGLTPTWRRRTPSRSSAAGPAGRPAPCHRPPSAGGDSRSRAAAPSPARAHLHARPSGSAMSPARALRRATLRRRPAQSRATPRGAVAGPPRLGARRRAVTPAAARRSAATPAAARRSAATPATASGRPRSLSSVRMSGRGLTPGRLP
jgi:hypothetical protein